MMWDTESSRFSSTAGPPDDSGTELVRADQNNVHIPRDRRLGVFTTARWKWSLQDRSWRLGLHVGLYASIIVLFGNVALLSYGMAQHDNTTQGVATIAKGERDQINSIGNAYHVLINIMSTILLTSSSYTMQILCAPTRREIECVHASGNWLEIGIMSIHNLRYIDRKRVAIWLLLVVSSVPLHLFYNSSIFTALATQDYDVTVTSASDASAYDFSNWTTLDNTVWPSIYATSWVPGYSDIHLIIDRVSFYVSIFSNWTYALEEPSQPNCDVTPSWLHNETITMELSHVSDTNKTLMPVSGQRVMMDTTGYLSNIESIPRLDWPTKISVKADGPRSLPDLYQLCPGNGWLLSRPQFHVRNARAKFSPYTNRVQVAIPFLSVVVLVNVVKIFGIWYAIHLQSSNHVITTGDAIATFLDRPELQTEGKCTITKAQICSTITRPKSQPWRARQKPIFVVLGGARIWSTAVIVILFTLTIAALMVAKSPGHDSYSWGTASKSTIPITSTSFDARGMLRVTFLANIPQVCLSLLYFSLNRFCTSICFAIEWNQYGKHRKGLRVTTSSGKQRSTHFLQLPLRWAIPLTIMSGVLHWLLSQSLFLVRQEVRRRNGILYPGSACACGYSAQSLLAFTLTLFLLLVAVLYQLLREIDIHIPPASHCSLVISAACHPPEDDVDPHLAKVKWGVTVEATESSVGHCTFTSQSVTSPQSGALYA